MKYYFCLVPSTDRTLGTNIGRTYAYANRSKWVEASDGMCEYLTSGYVKGVDHVVVDNKAYMIMKSYIDVKNSFVVLVCVESVSGCDI